MFMSVEAKTEVVDCNNQLGFATSPLAKVFIWKVFLLTSTTIATKWPLAYTTNVKTLFKNN